MEYIYLLRAGINYKIGRTKNLDNRIKALQTGSPYPIVPLYAEQTIEASRIEAELHRQFDKLRLSGEWFDLAQVADDAQVMITDLCGEDYVGQFDAGDEQVWARYGNRTALAIRYRFEAWLFEHDSF